MGATSGPEYKDKVQSVGFGTARGKTRVKPVENDERGGLAGVQIERWSGEESAKVYAPDTVLNPHVAAVSRLNPEGER